LDIDNGIIAISGNNGTGKTNILEAVSMLSSGRGIRGARLSDMSYFDGQAQHPWAVFAQINTKDGIAEIGTAINIGSDSSDTRIVKINGEKQRGQNILSEYIPIFALTPSADQTFADGSTSRRGFLDNICSFFYRDYNSLLGAFNNLKSQRRNLLLNRRFDEHWINSIEGGMAEKAVAIAFLRNETVININKTVARSSDYGFPTAEISIVGDIENFLISGPKENPEQYYKTILKNNREQDSRTGRTSQGPHKSDFRVIHEIKKMPAELCSQGEQKAMLLSVTIATIFAKKAFSGVTPILLLDEVYAHLDNDKKRSLYEFISHINCQTWLTGTEKESFEGLNNCQFIEL
jgi:DNA replication and repair protein RecF